MDQKASKLNKSRSSKLKKVSLLPLTMLLTISCSLIPLQKILNYQTLHNNKHENINCHNLTTCYIFL